MIFDSALIVSGSVGGTALAPAITGQTVTGASAVLSTNTIDLSSGGTPSGQVRDIGEGNDLVKALVEITTAFTGLTALTVEVIQADDAALSTNVTVVGSSGAIAVARLIAGARFEVELNARIGSTGQRYLGLRYTPTGTGTAGALLGHFGAEYTDGQKFTGGGYAVL